MMKAIKGFKVVVLLHEGHEAGLSPEELGWQNHQDPEIKDGFLIIRKGLNTYGLPLSRIHFFSIEAVTDE
ncbi:hypothetical protein ACSG8L_000315 [Cronobacter sakazakii]